MADVPATRAFNLGIRFLLELGMLAAISYWGFTAGRTTVVDAVLGVGAPLVAAALWGVLAAPKSERRLQGLALVVVQVSLLSLGGVALIAAGRAGLGAFFIAVVLVNAAMLGLEPEG